MGLEGEGWLGAGSRGRAVEERETRGMNRKAERGGDPGSKWGPGADCRALPEDNVREKE